MAASEIVSVNPATLEENGRVPAASRADVHAAVKAARAAQARWAVKSLDERARFVRRFGQVLLAEKRAVAEIVTREAGKPVPEAIAADVLPALEAATWLAKHGHRVIGEERFRNHNLIAKDRVSRVRYAPKGVVGIIAPWNYPFGIPASQALFALYAGNAVVLKPSEWTTLTALKLKALLDAAGFPEDLVHVVPGFGEPTGAALVEAEIDHLVFTGSVETGRKVQRECHVRDVHACLELGGSDPAIVLEDADVEVAANGIAWGRFTNGGQTCAAPKRVFVHERVADAFTERLVGVVEKLRVGNGLDDGVDVGPVVSAAAVEKMEAFVADAVKRGARVLAGGKRLDVPGHYFAPTVLVDVPEDARVLHEETFGPVLPIVRVKDDEDAVRRANATPFGLSASVWSKDKRRALALAERVDAGTVWVNDLMYTYALAETPWMGVKASGTGVTHGAWGLRELVQPRHVNVSPAGRPVHPPWWFPYGTDAVRAWEDYTDFLYGAWTRRARSAWGSARALFRKRAP